MIDTIQDWNGFWNWLRKYHPEVVDEIYNRAKYERTSPYAIIRYYENKEMFIRWKAWKRILG